jgi:signal transduction histidine kinase
VIAAARQYIPPMSPARLTLIVVALTAAAFPAAIADLVLVSPANPHASRGLGAGMIVIAALLAVPSIVASLLVRRRSGDDWLAPMLALTGFLPSLALLVAVFKEGPVAGYAVALSEGSWVLLFVSVALLVLFFPERRVRGRDRWLVWAIAIDALLFIVVGAMHPGSYSHPYERSPHVFGTLPHVVSAAIVAVTLPGILVLLVLTSVSVVRRYRRAGADVRAQMKWLALAAMLLPLTLLATWASYVVIPIVGEAGVFVGLGLAYAAIPTVIGIAVLRPDLFEVDRLLASTATHAIATGVVLVIFTAANLAAGLLLPGNSVPAAVAATALCALLLAPLRVRLQQRVDRWLYPARRSALAAIEVLNRQTATAQARPEQLEAVLQQAIGDATLRVGFLAADRTGVVDLAGASLEPAPGSVPVRLGGEQIGLVVSGRTSRELLRDIAAAAAPTIEVIRLRLGLRQALREVEASRSRMLRAGYDERERLERDLHDGAQLRLVSLGMALRLAQRRLPNGGVDVDGLLDQAVAELGTAVSELRQLANGIRPSCLDDGLVPALSVLIDAVPIPVDMHVAETHVDGDLQTTAYYVASEAIANAVKHSCATKIAVHVDARGDDLYVRVEDDGVGGAEQRDGSGLARLADRVGAHGGTLFVSSPRNGGTTVEAILPCAS